MRDSHGFPPDDSPAFARLSELLEARTQTDVPQRAASQPVFERALREHLVALEREIHQADFEAMDTDVEGIVVEGQRYRRRTEKTVGTYTTLAGPIQVQRSTYIPRGGHGGPAVVPLEMRLGLVDGGWTPVAAEVAGSYMASVPSREAVELLAQVGTLNVSASHLDRPPPRRTAAWEADREAIEEAVREADSLPDPDQVAVIMLSLDGVMVPMKDAPRTPGAGKQDTGPKGHREAACGTIALFDAQEERLHTIRWGRMPESKKVTLRQQLEVELRRMVERYPAARVTAVADGASENWRIVDEVAAALGIDIEVMLDFWHGMEHICGAIRLGACGDRGTAEREQSYWRRVLQEQDNGVQRLLHGLDHMHRHATGSAKRTIGKEFNYVVRHQHQMHYARARREGRPIGSGIQEAACGTLVSDRMKLSGMSWSQEGGQGILTLRSLKQSERWDSAWKELRKRLVKTFDVDTDTTRQRPAGRAA